MNRNITIAVYSHPEYYPPTLNALNNLYQLYNNCNLICSNVLTTNWAYPNNVTLQTIGEPIHIRAFENQSLFLKVKHFFKFTKALYKHAKSSDTVLLYDAMPLFAYRICKFFGRKNKIVWYHNHDVFEPSLLRKYSLSWLAYHNEKKALRWVDVFTLPSNERKEYFNVKNFKGNYFYIPNFPSVKFYKSFTNGHEITDTIKILYQGSIGKGHGFEEIISVMPVLERQISKTVKFIFKGFISDEYKRELIDIATANSVHNNIEFVGATPYKEVSLITQQCHIGVAIHTGQDRMNTSLGTASNKIYEYAACGLAVLYYDSPHYKTYLQQYEWAKACTLEKDNLCTNIINIVSNFNYLSKKAKADFEANLNFETNFKNVLARLENEQ